MSYKPGDTGPYGGVIVKVNNILYEAVLYNNGSYYEWGAYNTTVGTSTDVYAFNGAENTRVAMNNPACFTPESSSNTTIWTELQNYRASTGNNDWFIPSDEELDTVSNGGYDVKGSSTIKGTGLWSSTEMNKTNACYADNGMKEWMNNTSKDATRGVMFFLEITEPEPEPEKPEQYNIISKVSRSSGNTYVNVTQGNGISTRDIIYVEPYLPGDRGEFGGVVIKVNGILYEAVLYDTDPYHEWGAYGTTVGTSTDTTAYNGISNTQIAMANSACFVDDAGGNTTIWQKLKDYRTSTENSSWFIPSYKELDTIRTGGADIKGSDTTIATWFSKPSGYYIWSSTESTNNFAWEWDKDSQRWNDYDKFETGNVVFFRPLYVKPGMVWTHGGIVVKVNNILYEAALYNSGSTHEWGARGTEVGASTGTTTYDGLSNTNIAMANSACFVDDDGGNNTIWQKLKDYRISTGNNNWFVPSRAELETIRTGGSDVKGSDTTIKTWFYYSVRVWSSTEDGSDGAWRWDGSMWLNYRKDSMSSAVFFLPI